MVTADSFLWPSVPPSRHLIMSSLALRDTGTPPTSTHSHISEHMHFQMWVNSSLHNHAALPCPHIPRRPSATQRTGLSSSVLLGVLSVPCELSPFPPCPCSPDPTYTCFLLSSWGPLTSQPSRFYSPCPSFMRVSSPAPTLQASKVSDLHSAQVSVQGFKVTGQLPSGTLHFQIPHDQHMHSWTHHLRSPSPEYDVLTQTNPSRACRAHSCVIKQDLTP